MGIVSRRVLPACGKLCFFCPSLRARSRHPVKRYKKMLAEIFPRNQEAESNDRKIGKLCEYASKNPLRIPKITDYLEQKCYKDLRNGNIGSVKVVLCVYGKLLSTCKEQMPLFSCSLLGIIRTLLEQTRKEEIQILGCNTLVDFIDCQIDSTYMFNLEGLIPKLCQLAQEVGENERALRLRSAGMQALAFMVSFMGEHSHISVDFDTIITAILENSVDLQMSGVNLNEDGQNSQTGNQWVQGVCKDKENGSSFPDMSRKVSFQPSVMGGSDFENTDTSKSPSYWSRVCLFNIAGLAKEATTVRRVLEPLFHAFDAGKHWSAENGVASSVLLYLQSLLEESGENSNLLLSTLIKHLDHKNVVKQPLLQVDIVNVTTCLAQSAKRQASAAITAVIADLIRHLRKCLQNLAESASPANDIDGQNSELQSALESCIAELSNKVGDVGPILDMIAVVLENVTTNVVIARATLSAVFRTARIISFVPNISYYKKVFPDALFHQLLLAMTHIDHETRTRAHGIFSAVLLPSLLLPWSDQDKKISRAVSGIISVNALQKVRSESFAFLDEGKDKRESINVGLKEEGSQASDASLIQSTRSHNGGHLYSFKVALADGKKPLTSLRLSSHQVSLLLSSIWVQAASPENTPSNFEAMAHTYNITLLFARAKTSSHMAMVRCFQLAFSLRNLSLDQAGCMQPSRRRSLFTLASYMLISLARVGNLPDLIPVVKAPLTDQTVDPYLELVEDIRLRDVGAGSDRERMISYGSKEDDIAALNSLSAIELDDKHLRETVISHFTTKGEALSEEELLSIKKQILVDFSPDDAYPIGLPLFMETPGSPLAQIEFPVFEEVELSTMVTDEEASPEPNGSQSGRRTSLSTSMPDILSVNELLESVSETARQVASFPVSKTPIPYDQMKNQCEALVTGKQQKMLVLQSFKQRDSKAIIVADNGGNKDILISNTEAAASEDDLKLMIATEVQPPTQLSFCSQEYGQHSFQLPPSSPYDKFLKAAGC